MSFNESVTTCQVSNCIGRLNILLPSFEWELNSQLVLNMKSFNCIEQCLFVKRQDIVMVACLDE